MGQADITIYFCAFIATVLIYRRYGSRSSPPYPPGPKPLPLLGNVHQFPDGFEWITYDKWCKELNTDIVFLRAFGNKFLVLNSMDSINDLLERRSSIYSSRPKFPMAGELMGWKWMFAIMKYGDSWKEHRRVFTNYFNAGNSTVYQHNHAKFAREMLPVLLDNPQNFMQISRHAVGGWALSMAYGFPIKRANDPNVELAERALSTMNAALLPANFMVNIIPALMHVPEFFPGGGFKKQAREWKKIQEKMLDVPFEKVVSDMKSGCAKGSFTVSGLQGLEGNTSKERVQMIKESAGMVFTDRFRRFGQYFVNSSTRKNAIFTISSDSYSPRRDDSGSI